MWAKFLRLGLVDYFRGLVVAAFGAVGAIIYPLVKAAAMGQHVIFPSWESIGKIALYAGVAYLFKNLFTNSKDQTFRLEPKPDK
jgi:ABC-type antimicrobial peptide transport system permease subunit